MDENNKFDVVGTNIAEKATMIWNVADMLRGPFKPHEYGLVILPMTVVKRFPDCLLCQLSGQKSGSQTGGTCNWL